jgi:hypothetical protein
VGVNGKQKGAGFERDVCKALSLWVSHGASVDLYWRSAMSGGRATVAKGAVRQAGDITAVAPEGHILTDQFYIECKTYKDLSLDCFIKGKGTLIDFWKIAQKEAAKYNRGPILIFKQNHWPIMICMSGWGADLLKAWPHVCVEAVDFDMRLVRFGDLVKKTFPLK